MFICANLALVEAAVSAATPKPVQTKRLPLQLKKCGRRRGFTLVELLVSVAVIVLLVLLATQLLNSAATITTLGHKQMDADSQGRQVLDRLALDFAQMVKRSDVDYVVKSSAVAPSRSVLQPGNDWIAFYSTVPGYYQTGPSTTRNSPISLISYRVNSQNKLERMGKGLVWNAVSTTDTPVLFLPVPLASPLPTPELPSPIPPSPLPTPAWPQTQNMTTDWNDSEVMGPQVFRFEYYYLLTNGTSSGIPWDTNLSLVPPHTGVRGMQDISAIVVDIAVIDAKSRVLVADAQLAALNGSLGSPPVLVDYGAGMSPGQLLIQWRAALDTNATGLPQPAISGIRVYERRFYLSPPTLLTP